MSNNSPPLLYDPIELQHPGLDGSTSSAIPKQNLSDMGTTNTFGTTTDTFGTTTETNEGNRLHVSTQFFSGAQVFSSLAARYSYQMRTAEYIRKKERYGQMMSHVLKQRREGHNHCTPYPYRPAYYRALPSSGSSTSGPLSLNSPDMTMANMSGLSTRYDAYAMDPPPSDLILFSEDSVFFYVHLCVLLNGSDNGFGGLLARHSNINGFQGGLSSMYLHSPPLNSPSDASSDVLSFSSPELDSLPESDNETTAPVLGLSDSSQALNVLLHALYELDCSQYSPSWETLVESVELAEKYGYNEQLAEWLTPPPTVAADKGTITDANSTGVQSEAEADVQLSSVDGAGPIRTVKRRNTTSGISPPHLAHDDPQLPSPPTQISNLYTMFLSYASLKPLELYIFAAGRALESLTVAASAYLHSLPLYSLTDQQCLDMGAIYLKRLFFLHLGRVDALKVRLCITILVLSDF